MPRTLPKITPLFAGFLQGVAIILSIVGINAVGSTGVLNSVPDPSVMMLLFTFLVLLCIGLGFGYPAILVSQKRIKHAVVAFAMTLATIAVLVVGWVGYLFTQA